MPWVRDTCMQYTTFTFISTQSSHWIRNVGLNRRNRGQKEGECSCEWSLVLLLRTRKSTTKTSSCVDEKYFQKFEVTFSPKFKTKKSSFPKVKLLLWSKLYHAALVFGACSAGNNFTNNEQHYTVWWLMRLRDWYDSGRHCTSHSYAAWCCEKGVKRLFVCATARYFMAIVKHFIKILMHSWSMPFQ